jgi:hypothetical protein
MESEKSYCPYLYLNFNRRTYLDGSKTKIDHFLKTDREIVTHLEIHVEVTKLNNFDVFFASIFTELPNIEQIEIEGLECHTFKEIFGAFDGIIKNYVENGVVPAPNLQLLRLYEIADTRFMRGDPFDMITVFGSGVLKHVKTIYFRPVHKFINPLRDFADYYLNHDNNDCLKNVSWHISGMPFLEELKEYVQFLEDEGRHYI